MKGDKNIPPSTACVTKWIIPLIKPNNKNSFSSLKDRNYTEIHRNPGTNEKLTEIHQAGKGSKAVSKELGL